MELTSWLPVVGGILCINVLLCIVQRCGTKSLLLTWIPGKLLLLFAQWIVASQPDTSLISETLGYVWASIIVPVLFLNTFHYFLSRSREPRFHSGEWFGRWCLALLVVMLSTVVVWITCRYDETRYGVALLGAIALILNVDNVTNAPTRLVVANSLSFSYSYWVVVNLVSLAVFLAMKYLLEYKQYLVVGILSNLPLFPIALLAAAALQPQAALDIKQQTFMLSYQNWPALGMVLGSWLTLQYCQLVEVALVVGMMGMIVVICLQYWWISDILDPVKDPVFDPVPAPIVVRKKSTRY